MGSVPNRVTRFSVLAPSWPRQMVTFWALCREMAALAEVALLAGNSEDQVSYESMFRSLCIIRTI